jgi:hypothetical protein
MEKYLFENRIKLKIMKEKVYIHKIKAINVLKIGKGTYEEYGFAYAYLVTNNNDDVEDTPLIKKENKIEIPF